MKEFIGVRVDSDLFNAILELRAKTGMSLTQIVTNALEYYISNATDKLVEELKQIVEQKRLRERNRRLIRGLTLVDNQIKLIRKLRRQGLSDEQLKILYDGLKEEAQAYGLELPYSINDFYKIKPIKRDKNDRK